MSMLGISFLNEIMSSKNINSASQVLDEMRRYVIDSLQQSVINTGDTSAYRNEIRMKDGMDMTFVVIDKNKLEMQYSGANNSVYIVTTSDDSIESAGNSQWVTYSGHGVNKLIEIKGDKMPVAIHERMEPFVNKIIPLRQGDVVYLLSDGYVDQFGGPKGRKFMSKQFRELLLNNSEVSLADQRNLFDESLEYWKNGFDTKFKQTDDITLVGIRI
jgi:serine phosphatase RsbU (regulator of sigma subunit)